MTTQETMFISDTLVFAFPDSVATAAVELIHKNGLWYVYFITTGGKMLLGKKSSITEPLGFVRLQSAVDRIRKLGWSSDIKIKGGF